MAELDWHPAEDALFDWLSLAFAYPAWRTSTLYRVGARRSASGNSYEVTSTTGPGTSASSGAGPSGQGASISDGNVVWKFLHAGAAPPVVWSGPARPELAVDHLAISIPTFRPRGISGGIRQDLTRPPGQEIEIITGGWADVGLTIKALSEQPIGAHCARSILFGAGARLTMAAGRELLAAVGFSLLSVGVATALPELKGTAFQGRAAVDVQLLARDTASEFVGYVHSVDVTYNVT